MDTAFFRVKPGYRFGKANQHGPGDVVELPAPHARAFLDKLEPVVVGPVATKSEPIPDDFPGARHLRAAGVTALADVPTGSAELVAITGIGSATADAILEALAEQES